MTNIAGTPTNRPLTLSDGASGGLHIFALDPPEPTKLGPRGVGVLPTMLGFPDLDPDFGEIVSPQRLGGTQLVSYIEQTYGLQISPQDAAVLNEASGRLAIVRNRAFGDGPAELSLKPGIWYLLTLTPPPRSEPAPVLTELEGPEPKSGPSPLWLIPLALAAIALLVWALL